MTGLPRPVSARFATAAGASVAAGSGSKRTVTARPIEIRVHASPAASIAANGNVVPTSDWRVCVAAPSSNIPVTPPPMAASVSATSTAASLTQASDRSSPYTTKVMTAVTLSRAAIVQAATATSRAVRPTSKAMPSVTAAALSAAACRRPAGRQSHRKIAQVARCQSVSGPRLARRLEAIGPPR